MQSEAEKYDNEEESMQVLFTCLPSLEFPHTLDLFFRAVSSLSLYHFMHQPSNVLHSSDTAVKATTPTTLLCVQVPFVSSQTNLCPFRKMDHL